jgi:hypothetical protein
MAEYCTADIDHSYTKHYDNTVYFLIIYFDI